MTNTTTTAISSTTTDTDALIARYFDMWQTTDPTERAELVAATFTADGRHVDQHEDAVGHAALAEMLTGVHTGFPGFRIARTSGIDRVADQLRYTWELVGADGTPIVAGLDTGELAPDGRLRRVAAFWGDLPAV